ncbi:serine--tRNA synthetase-like protein Slimp [Athalia rosae]|uniref:serine--tRNA synthetase-like protein Slimp n=1 Tax=Athalia rosae TaxID=37344 RepID=UPI0020338461|nr:serine--tRNA synthetase-like protein Slimp [Athalia rosae]
MALICTRLSGLLHLAVRKSVSSFSQKPSPNILTRFNSSALFIPGNKANETFAVLTPYFDCDERFSNMDELKKNLQLRGLDMDVDSIKKSWDFYKKVNSDRVSIEDRRVEVATQIKARSQKTDRTENDELEIARLKSLGKVLREDLKVLKEVLWELEGSVIIKALKLPNFIHDQIPETVPSVLHTVGETISTNTGSSSKNHIEIGERLGLLDYTSPMNYYLLNDAALFELGILRLASDVLSSVDMLHVTGLDFTRSVIVEGAGVDHEDHDVTFILQDNEEIDQHSCNRMHLVGGASLASFLAMHTKQLINPKDFPLRYYATGRQYNPFSRTMQEAGLFTVCQSSVVEVFTVVKDFRNSEYRDEFDKIIRLTQLLYDELCSHHRTVVRPARELRSWESMRVSFEVWSSYLSRYVEVGHISMCGEYFSKRLLIGCQTPHGRTFPSVISGTILSVPRLLGCLLEQYPDGFLIPEKVKEHICVPSSSNISG